MGFLHIIAPASVGEAALREAGAAFEVYHSELVDAGSGEPCLLASLKPERDWTRYAGWPLHWASLEGRLDTHRVFPLFEAISRAAGRGPWRWSRWMASSTWPPSPCSERARS
ncbi:hypothetical protein [Polyangium sp. 15x6]|uniref:hypothetical protein n=1 Tax=Polyangium sp. 15x6 TaxID=3042687 RepID=UPI002499ADB6|nr:hypothetical protein [Polyangium sp. 15x6]MDI3290936.1 hypothetical protein [Polyangium sp. 15x6]